MAHVELVGTIGDPDLGHSPTKEEITTMQVEHSVAQADALLQDAKQHGRLIRAAAIMYRPVLPPLFLVFLIDANRLDELKDSADDATDILNPANFEDIDDLSIDVKPEYLDGAEPRPYACGLARALHDRHADLLAYATDPECSELIANFDVDAVPAGLDWVVRAVRASRDYP